MLQPHGHLAQAWGPSMVMPPCPPWVLLGVTHVPPASHELSQQRPHHPEPAVSAIFWRKHLEYLRGVQGRGGSRAQSLMVLIWALQHVLERFKSWKTCQEYRKEGAGGCVYRGPDASAGPLTQQPQRNSQQLEMEARKVQMRNKLQVFNSEQLSPRERERRSRFPAFQVFQHTRGAFLKKKKNKKTRPQGY